MTLQVNDHTYTLRLEPREPASRVSQRLAVQQGMQPLLRQLADQGHGATTRALGIRWRAILRVVAFPCTLRLGAVR